MKKTFYLTLSILVILSTLFSLRAKPQKVYADSCPSTNINQDTTWTTDLMVNDIYDCSTTDLTIDGATLTLETPFKTDNVYTIMNVRNLYIKNEGNIKIEIKYSYPEQIIRTISQPSNVSKVAVATGVGIQIISILSFLTLPNMTLANLIALLGQLLFGKSPLKNMWGIVYDSKTSKPIPFVTIRLFDSKSDQIIATTVTDLHGRYSLPTSKGSYYMEAIHEDYSFPSDLAKIEKDSKKNLYAGDEFVIKEEDTVDFNIPLDPGNYRIHFVKRVLLTIWTTFRNWALTGNYIFLGVLFVLNLFTTVIDFNVLSLFFAVIYFLLILFKLISSARSPKTWGKVYNSESKNTVPSAFVKLYLQDKKKLVDTKITDSKGRFQFFVPDNKYLLLVMASGYKFPSSKTPKKYLSFHKSLIQIEPIKQTINISVPIDPIKLPNLGGTGSSPFSG